MSDVFANLTLEDAEMPESARKGRAAGPNPFDAAIKDSWEREIAKSFVMENGKETNKQGTSKAVAKAIYLIRRAASDNNLGVALSLESVGKTKTRVTFQAQAKRPYTPRKRNAEESAETVATEETTETTENATEDAESLVAVG